MINRIKNDYILKNLLSDGEYDYCFINNSNHYIAVKKPNALLEKVIVKT